MAAHSLGAPILGTVCVLLLGTTLAQSRTGGEPRWSMSPAIACTSRRSNYVMSRLNRYLRPDDRIAHAPAPGAGVAGATER